MPKKAKAAHSAATKNSRSVSKTKKPTVVKDETGRRLLQSPRRVWYQPLSWRHKPPTPHYKPLPKARELFTTEIRQLWQNKKLFGGIVLIYGLLNLLLVRGLSGSSDLSSLKSTLDSAVHGFGGQLASSATSFFYLLASSGSGNTDTSGIYQAVLLIVCSLAFIWALRQTLAKHRVRIRDSFYQGMYPLIPFALLILLLCVQLLPLAIGSALYSTALSNAIIVNGLEKTVWLVIVILLALWSLRMITATIFSLYIVTLPNMTPIEAYRDARRLVFRRRLLIWRKLIFLPVVLLLLAACIELPLILYVTPIAEWIFFVFSMCALPLLHGYLYNLYRDML